MFVTFYTTIRMMTLEQDSLIFNEPWVLANEIMLNKMQNFKFDFLENEFWLTGVYVSSSISRTLHKFFMGFFSMYTVSFYKQRFFSAQSQCCLTFS